ncbi:MULTISPECIES: BTAD domain-containing putative transcriptional regulator [Thermocrispum]|uniref:BTAD domain-containing putative transcriptional regulator n=2 Tax=Thermocrispum agreste TaxID=37925 RepID=A0ABD6FHV6_9PSEU|nr:MULTISPECIES: BTAD domain-containing putative transcriptional regulator [Thermocrispum]
MPKDVSGLRVQLLGQPRAWLDGVEVALGQARQVAVFAILAGRGVGRSGSWVTVAELLDGVWGGAPPASARGSLHTYVSGLRRALRSTGAPVDPTEVLASQQGRYRLVVDRDAVDVARFEQAVAQARTVARGRPEMALSLVDEALADWSGDALLGVPGPFAERERARLEELRLSALELRAELMLTLGGHRELIPELTELTERHPLRESLYAALMQALHRDGRTGEALEVYYTAHRVLRAELGVEPSDTLHALHRKLLTGSGAHPVARHTGWLCVTPPARCKAAGHGVRLRGRDDELAHFDELITDLLAGRGGVLFVEGEPGAGKSALLGAALAAAGRGGFQLAWAVADPAHRNQPLRTITACFGPDAGVLDVPADVDDDVLETAADHLVDFVREACSRGPLAVVVDDMHWSDEASVVVWQRLASSTRQLPLLLVAAASSGHGRSDLATVKRCLRARGADVVELSRLCDDDVVGLVEDMLDARAGATLRSVLRRAVGNPLFATAMAEDLLRRGVLHISDGVADVDAEEPGLSRRMQAIVDRTLQFVVPETLRLLSTAALLGQEFAVSHLLAVADAAPLEVAEHVAAAIAAGILEPAEDAVTFRHPLQREALYQRWSEAARTVAHRRAAEALSGSGCPIEVVAHQLAAVTAPADAWTVAWLVDHRKELSGREPLLAADLVQRALDSEAATPEQRAVLLPELVRVLTRLGRNPLKLAEQAVDVATDPVDEADMRKLLGMLRRSAGIEAA